MIVDGASPESIAQAARLLAGGELVAFPTETVYGFGTAVDRESVATLIRMKRRPPGKPFLLLIANLLDRWVAEATILCSVQSAAEK